MSTSTGTRRRALQAMSRSSEALVRVARLVYRRLHGRELRLAGIALAQALRGSSVVNPAGHRIRFDPWDLRGRKLFRSSGVLDRDAVRLWNRLAGVFEPTLVIDVGANYGEVLLSRAYPPDAELHVVEANPRVAKYLAANVRTAVPTARVHVGAATDRSGTIRLHLRSPWGAPYSGTASVELQDHLSRSLEVRAFRLDEEISGGGRLLFKLDVEGHETSVLRGMSRLLHGDWIGMCEISSLTRDHVDWLRSEYQVLHVDRTTLATRPAMSSGPGASGEMKDVILLPKDADVPFP